MLIDLTGKVALVTGGSRGIGAAISLALGGSGARVAANYMSDHRSAQAFARKMQQKKLVSSLVAGDVGDFLEAESVVRQVIDRFGRLDIVVNNAGIWEPNPIDHPRSEESWDRMIRTNLKGAFNICTHALPYLTKAKGRIVNIASTAGQRGEPAFSHYAASKGGVIAFTKSLAAELGPYQVLVNAVSPGWIWTDMSMKHLSKPVNRKEALRQIPLGKFGQPEDVANAVLFLVSPLATHITGEVLNVNGGSVLQ
ncbi:MAG: SDR family NAD(P)-dependent oxidoreductase [Pseudomonadota bacterium]